MLNLYISKSDIYQKKDSRKFYLFLTFLLVSYIFIVKVNGQPVLPAPAIYPTPNPAPAAPGEAFSGAMSGAPNPNAPACAEWTRTAGPDESIVITGSNFSRYQGDQQAKDSRFTLMTPNGNRTEASIQRIDDDKALITLPKSIPAWGMYLIWPGNEAGYGNPIAVNKTEAWWLGPDKAPQGSSLSVFGRNLAQNNGTTSSNVYIKPANAAGQWATTTRVNPYKVDFTLPPSLAPGDYEVWVHNGHGGQFGWSGPLKLTIQADMVVSSTILNVKDFGAKGDGIADDTQPINQAIKAAPPGATVYLPAGTYIVTNTITLKSTLIVKGDGPTRTSIRCGSNFSSGSYGLLYMQNLTNVEVRDMTLEANRNYRGNYSVPIYARANNQLRLTNLKLNFPGYDPIDLHLSKYVFLTNCEIIGKLTFLGNCSQLFIDQCHFKMTNDTELAMHSWGGQGVSLTNSSCADLDNANPNDGAGWGQGRFFVGNGAWGGIRSTYIGDNRTLNLAPRPTGVDQNTGEQLLWEGMSTDWTGTASSSTELTTTLNGMAGNIANPDYLRYAVIIKGKGLGQSRQIVGYNGETITLEKAWNVPPDGQSWISIGRYLDQVVVYSNQLDGKQAAVESVDHKASAGIEPFGGVFNFIADNNTIQETRYGLANWALEHSGQLDPNYFSFYANNKLINCRWGIHNAVGITKAFGTGMLGTVFRHNTVTNARQSGIANSLGKSVLPTSNSFIYEYNTITGVPNGYTTSGDVGPYEIPLTGNEIENQFFYKNTIAGSIGYGIKVTPKIALRENNITGFPATYNGSSLVLEAPHHVIDMSGWIGGKIMKSGFQLWNSGVNSMAWTASSNVPWLTLSATSGTIQDQHGSTTLELSANPNDFKTEGYFSATITVTVGNQTETYSVILRLLNDTAITFLNTRPNPSQEKVTIEFTLTEDTDATLQIFNTYGVLLETLFEGHSAIGESHILEFDGRKYQSNVYLCKLTYGQKAITKKLILNK